MEWVLLMPKQLAQTSFRTLVASGCMSRPWQLKGRHGSRTHPCPDGKVGIPVVSKKVVLRQAESFPDLKDLIETTAGVELVFKPYRATNRKLAPPPFDARIHPERAPKEELIVDMKAPQSQTALTSTSPAVKKPVFTFAELFAGIGGFGVALEALGGTCVFCSELSDQCRQVYQKNFPSTKNLYGDIYAVRDEDLPHGENLDLLVGGFPCQPFSALGDQPGMNIPDGNLFQQIVRVLQVSKPSAFLLENVPGLLEMKDTFDIIVKAFEDSGYLVTTEVCNARGLTAQSRKRLFFVGLRKTDKQEEEPFEFPYVPDLHLRARDVIYFEEDEEDSCEDAAASDYLSPLLYLSDEQLEKLRTSGRWRPSDMVWPDIVCHTLVSHYGNSVTRGRHSTQLVPTNGNPRRLSVRECARVMGFPSTFELLDKRPEQGDMAWFKVQYHMLGNAVCPPLIAALAGAVLQRCLLSSETKNNESSLSGVVSQAIDWVARGRSVAIQLALEATRQ